jgi:uncharacterized DUF497 family protein
MQDDQFEWDDAKAAANHAKHGVSFDEARPVFDDPFALVLSDDSAPGEERWRLIGMSGGRVLFAVFTEPAHGRRRIISARRATKREQDAYAKQAHD